MPVPKNSAPTTRVLLRDVVFDRLLDAIVRGELAPGETLRDNEMEAWAGASRTPVREAIDRLASMGLVEVLPQKGTRVAPIEAAAFADRLETLWAISEGVAEDVVPLLTDDDVALLTTTIARLHRPDGDQADIPAVTSDLFAVLLNTWANTYVLKIYDTVIPHLRREATALAAKDDAYFMTSSELDGLAGAIRNRDGEAAAASIRHHCERVVTHTRQQASLVKE
ncbi:GntR family transcriptional regulator [Microbacterium hydrocarbonoxydans]|uniref:GntR family transcriptional regulator n=1 Tax=Microbacterium hydrocarbonoxydans TaxID=273678 RepID=UPI00203BA1D3|nr:GntR family transcriptional regulator [Microbacterium hydrocarbonoxydans]MCM3781279.1 GntR family transcriptional regulator [Microbacterium hydrocarbonoxydans]